VFIVAVQKCKSSPQCANECNNASVRPRSFHGSRMRYLRKLSFLGVVIALAALSLLAIAGCSSGTTSSSAVASSSPVSSEGSSSAGALSSASSSSSSSSSAASSAKESIEFKDVVIDQDSIGRYYIKGTATNTADVSYDVTFNVKLVANKADGSSKEHSTRELITDMSSDLPWLVMDKSDVTLLGLEAGKSREFTIYPNRAGDYIIGKSEVTIESPELSVSKVVESDARGVSKSVPDFNSELAVDVLSFNGERLSGTITNNTGKYVSAATLNFTTYDSSGLPIPESMLNKDRPTGVKVVSEKVRNLEPGGTFDFDIDLGSCADYRLRDAYYDVDQAKS